MASSREGVLEFSLYKSLQVVGFEGSFWFEAFLAHIYNRITVSQTVIPAFRYRFSNTESKRLHLNS